MTHDFTPWLAWLDEQHQQMLDDTLALAEINSGTLNHTGVNRVGEALVRLCQPLGGETEILPVAPYQHLNSQGELDQFPLGNAVRIRKRPEAPLQIFLCGHMDTVFAVDHPFQQIQWLDDDTVNGPGVADLKGGLLVMINALMALERSPWADQIGWQILFNPDEEIGSPSSAALIAEAAKEVDLGMIYEPSFPDGNLAGERKGSGNFSVVVRGKAAHAGREHHLGRNAIRAMADFIAALDDLNGQRQGVTINPGFIEGGGAVNIVPDLCISRFNIRLEQVDDEAWCQQHLDRLLADINARDGISIELHGGFGRKPKKLSGANQKLFELARDCGAELGMSISWLPTGGCCDGNNLAAAGIPNIDTLGVRGGKIHSSDEYMHVSSLTERAKLSALILMKLATSSDRSWLGER
ncbi:hydrolase [Marinobacterium stanieri]|uniref:Glutamate carboxypeptidase n=1 Tax=Marinobacterium stanieri TaxID=49186 RepID=A0A1N6P4Z5_9GAMM|nr:hydrolase [Marinobacterium stanieri]SIP99343.1 glutamate carboxypeptidase [Marinobacterium stanieri]